MKALLPADLPVGELGELPDGVRVVAVDRARPLPDDAARADFLLLSFELAPRLEELAALVRPGGVVQALSAGVDWLLPRVPDHVVLCSARGVHDVSVSEWCVAAILAMERRLLDFLDLQREARWERDVDAAAVPGGPALDEIHDLDGRDVLVLGHGSIGRALEARLRPFGARVTGVARRAREGVAAPEELPRLLPAADVVVLLLPLTPETERTVDGAFLARMKRGALLVNAARGRLVDTAELEASLRAGRVRAALDTTDPEPLPDGHSLWHAPNVLVTPHVAGSTARWRERAHRFAGDQIRRLAAGEPPLNVSAEY